MLHRLRNLFNPAPLSHTDRIQVTDVGFMVESGKSSWSIPWAEVERVAFFQRSIGIVDEILCAVEFKENGETFTIEIREGMDGFGDFMHAVGEKLPGLL